MKRSTTPAAEAAPAQVAHDGVYGQYELTRIRKSPDNRKLFNEQALLELAASVKAMGVVQPVLIRPVTPSADAPEEFEIVAGERRYRASVIAGLATIPAMCRELSDLDAAKIRILENLQREDPHPAEEAEGYQQLMLQHGYTVDQLADDVHKSRAYIYARLKLCALTTEVREQFMANKIPASTALLIARIPIPKLQAQALAEITATDAFKTELMSYRSAQQHIQRRYMLDLTTAVFKISDTRLVASAGACGKCPKRAGNQPEVFADVSADVCTDPDCFEEKRQAHYDAMLDKAAKAGIPVFEHQAGRDKLSGQWGTTSDLVSAGLNLHYFHRNAPATKNAGSPKTHLSDAAMPPAAALVKNHDGTITPMYQRDAMQLALEAAGVCEAVADHAERMAEQARAPSEPAVEPAAVTRNAAAAQAYRESEEKAAREASFRVALYKRMRARGAAGFTLESLRALVKHLLADYTLPVDQLGDIYDFDTSDDATIGRHIDGAGLPEVQLLMMDLLLGHELPVSHWQIKELDPEADFATVLAMARHEGIDPAEVRRTDEVSRLTLADLDADNLLDFVKFNPARIDETHHFIVSERPHLVGALDFAAKELGYVYADKVFRQPVAEVAEQAVPKKARLSPAAAWPFPKTRDEAINQGAGK